MSKTNYESLGGSVSDDIRKYSELSEDELFALLGMQLRRSDEALQHSDDNDSGIGRQYFLSKYQQIRQTVCNSSVVIELVDGKRSEDIELIAMVAGALGGHFDKIVATLTALLVARRGLLAFCSKTE